MRLLSEVVFDTSKITSENLILTVVGYLIVFIALIILYFVFQYLPLLLNINLKKKADKKTPEDKVLSDVTITGEVSAAISTGLFMYFNEMHDDDNTVLTIKKISKRYSPWSSKIYGVTRGLNRRF
jgi:Na+-transporting methylmalonyl-CoA/oxaloacetate decarboxylase gamma subunit